MQVEPARSDHLLPRRHSFAWKMTKAHLGKAGQVADEANSAFE